MQWRKLKYGIQKGYFSQFNHNFWDKMLFICLKIENAHERLCKQYSYTCINSQSFVLFIKRVLYRLCPWMASTDGTLFGTWIRKVFYFFGTTHCSQSSICCWKRSICSVVSKSSYFFWMAVFARFNTSSGSASGTREIQRENKDFILFSHQIISVVLFIFQLLSKCNVNCNWEHCWAVVRNKCEGNLITDC